CNLLWPSHRRASRVKQDGNLAGNSCLNDFEDARYARAASWIWNCPPDRADQRRSVSPNYGTLYPSLLKLEQEGWIVAEWGTSENNRKAKYYKLTRAGRKQLERETKEW